MKFFATIEAYKDVSSKLIIIQNVIATKIKAIINDKNYGEGVSYWGYISICNPSNFYDAGFFKEIKKYTKKDTEVELRLRIDYEEMLKADDKEISKLVCTSILRGIDIAENELKIQDFNFEAYRNDLTSLFKKEGWL